MSTETGKLLWRVRAADDSPHAAAFDALVLPTDASSRARLGLSPRLLGTAVPYEAELTDTPVALVVRARANAGRLIVECEAIGPDGERRVYGRATEPLAVIVRSPTGVLVTGLPTEPADPLAPAT
jgi:hypothetical protein